MDVYFTPSDVRAKWSLVTWVVDKTFPWQPRHVATTSRDPNAGQVQQQATGATTGAKLSHTELNVLKTMITVIVCFFVLWSAFKITDFLVIIQVRSLVPSLHIQ